MHFKKCLLTFFIFCIFSAFDANSLPIRHNQVALDYEKRGEKQSVSFLGISKDVLNAKYVDPKLGTELSYCDLKKSQSFLFFSSSLIEETRKAINKVGESNVNRNPKNIDLSSYDWKYNCANTDTYSGACWVRSLGLKGGNYYIEACFQTTSGDVQCQELRNGESKSFWRTEVKNFGITEVGYEGGYGAGTEDCPDTSTNINALGYAYIYEATQMDDTGKNLKYKDADDFFANYCRPLAENQNPSRCSNPSVCPCDEKCKKNGFIPPKDSDTWKMASASMKDCYICLRPYRAINFYCSKVYKCLMEKKGDVYDLAMDETKRKLLPQIYGRGNYTCAYFGKTLCGCAKTKLSGGPRHFLRIARQDNVEDKEANSGNLTAFPQHNLFSTSVYVRQFYNEVVKNTDAKCPYSHKAEFGYKKRGTFFFPKLTLVAGKNERVIGYKYDYIKNNPDFYYNTPIGITEPYSRNTSTYDLPVARKIIYSHFYPVIFTIGSTYQMLDEEHKTCVEKPSQDMSYVAIRMEYNVATNSTAVVAYRITPVKTIPYSMRTELKMLATDGSFSRFIATNDTFINKIKNDFAYDYDPSQHFTGEKKKLDIKDGYKLLFENIGKVERPPLKYTYQSDDSSFIVSPIVLENDLSPSAEEDKYAAKLKLMIVPYNLKKTSEEEFENDSKLPIATARLKVFSMNEDAYKISGDTLDRESAGDDEDYGMLYMKKFSVGYTNPCVSLRTITGAPGTDLLLDPPKNYNECSSYTSAKDKLHCLSAFLLVDECNAYASCLPDAKSIEDCKLEDREPKIKITGSASQLDSYKINTDFRQHTKICVKSGFDFADRLSELSNTKLFGRFGNPVYDYTIRYNREYGNAFTSSTRPLTLKGKDTRPNAQNDAQDDPRYISTMDINYFSGAKQDRFDNMILRLKGLYIVSGDGLPTTQSLFQHYANDCTYSTNICKNRFSVEHRLIQETQGSLCVDALKINGGAWDLQDRELPYDVYIPYRCQYVRFDGVGAGGAGFTTESHTSCLIQIHVTLISWYLNPAPLPNFFTLSYRRMPKFDATGSESGSVSAIIDINKIKVFDGYLQVKIGARTKKVRVEIPTHNKPHMCFVGTGGNSGVAESAKTHSSWIGLGGSHRFWYANGDEFIGKGEGDDTEGPDDVPFDRNKGVSEVGFDTHGVSLITGDEELLIRQQQLREKKEQFDAIINEDKDVLIKYYHRYTTLERYFKSLSHRARALHNADLALHKAIEGCVKKVQSSYQSRMNTALSEYNTAKENYDACKNNTSCTDLSDKEAIMNGREKIYEECKKIVDENLIPYKDVYENCDARTTENATLVVDYLGKAREQIEREKLGIERGGIFSSASMQMIIGASSEEGLKGELTNMNNKIAVYPEDTERTSRYILIANIIHNFLTKLNRILLDSNLALGTASAGSGGGEGVEGDNGTILKSGLNVFSIPSSISPKYIADLLSTLKTNFESAHEGTKNFLTNVVAENSSITSMSDLEREYANDFVAYNNILPDIRRIYDDSVRHKRDITGVDEYKKTANLSTTTVTTHTETTKTNKNSDVPETYRQVEYIRATGTQYIDLGVSQCSFTPAIFNTIYIKYVYEHWGGGSFIGIASPASGYSSSDDYHNYRFFRSPDGYTYFDAGINVHKIKVNYVNSTTRTYETRLAKYSIADFRDHIYVLGTGPVSSTLSHSDCSSTKSLMLFSPHDYGKVFYVKIYSYFDLSLSLRREYVPVYRISDGVVGLYETVEGRFYINSGSGTLQKGEEDVNTTTETTYEINTTSGNTDVFDVEKFEREHLGNFYPLDKALCSTYNKTANITNIPPLEGDDIPLNSDGEPDIDNLDSIEATISSSCTDTQLESAHNFGTCAYSLNAATVSQNLLNLSSDEGVVRDEDGNVTNAGSSPTEGRSNDISVALDNFITKATRLASEIADKYEQINELTGESATSASSASFYQVLALAKSGMSPMDCRVTDDISRGDCPYIDIDDIRSGKFKTGGPKPFPLWGRLDSRRCGRGSKSGVYLCANEVPTMECLKLTEELVPANSDNGGLYNFVRNYLYEGTLGGVNYPNGKVGSGSAVSTETDRKADVIPSYSWKTDAYRNKSPSASEDEPDDASHVNDKHNVMNNKIGAGGAFIHRKGTGGGGPGSVELVLSGFNIKQEEGTYSFYPSLSDTGQKTIVEEGTADAMCSVRCPPIYVLRSGFQIFFPETQSVEEVDMICEYTGAPDTDMEPINGKKHYPTKCYIVSDKVVEGVGELKGRIFVRDGYCPIAKCENGIWGFTTDAVGVNRSQVQYDRKAMMCKPKSSYDGVLKSSYYYSMMFDRNIYTSMSFMNASLIGTLLDTGKSHVIADCAKESTAKVIIDSRNQLMGDKLALRCDGGFWQDENLVGMKTVELYNYSNSYSARTFPDNGKDSEYDTINDNDDNERDEFYKNRNTHMYDTEYLIKNYTYQIGGNGNEKYKTTGIRGLKETGREVFKDQVYCPPIINEYDFEEGYSGNAVWEATKEYETATAVSCRGKRFETSAGLPTRVCTRNGFWGPVFNPCLKGCDDEIYNGINWTLNALGEDWRPEIGQTSVSVPGACSGKYLNSQNFLEAPAGGGVITRTCNLLAGSWLDDINYSVCEDKLVCPSDGMPKDKTFYTPFILTAILDLPEGYAKLKENLDHNIVELKDYSKYDESLYLIFEADKKTSSTFNFDYYSASNQYVNVQLITDGSIDLTSKSLSKYVRDDNNNRIIPKSDNNDFIIISVATAVSPSAFSYMLGQSNDMRNEFLNISNWIETLTDERTNYTGQWEWKGNLSSSFYKGITASTAKESQQRYKNARLLVVIKKDKDDKVNARRVALFSPYLAKQKYNTSIDDENIKFRVPFEISSSEYDNSEDPYPMIAYNGISSSSRVYRFEWKKGAGKSWDKDTENDGHKIGEHDCNGKYFGYIKHNTMKHVMFTETPLDPDVYFASLFCYDGRIFGYHAMKVNFPQNNLLNDVYTASKFLSKNANDEDFAEKIYNFMMEHLQNIGADKIINANGNFSIEKNSYIAGMMMKYWQRHIVPPQTTIDVFIRNYNPAIDTSPDVAENRVVKEVLQNYKNGATGYYYRVVPRRAEWITGTISNVVRNVNQIAELDDDDPYCLSSTCQDKKRLSNKLNNLVNSDKTNDKNVPNWQMCEI